MKLGHLTTRVEQHLRIFERKILRKIFGQVQDKDGSWRIRMNHELNELIGNADIVRFIKSRRIAWLGHVMRMDEKRILKRVLEWKTTGRRIKGRARKRGVEDTEEVIQALGIRGWRKLSMERTEWRRITEKAKTRPIFTHAPPGPGPRAANFQGRHIKKKSRLKYGMWKQKGCPRERNLREIYTENNVGTEFSRYDTTGARRS